MFLSQNSLFLTYSRLHRNRNLEIVCARVISTKEYTDGQWKGMKFALNSRTLPPLTLSSPLSLFNFQKIFSKTPSFVQIPIPSSKIKHPIIPFPKNFCRCYSVTMSSSAANGMPVERKEEINLTDKEKQIFDRLLQVLGHFNLQTQLRVAGGWVRDKLLGKECYDIDIALDDMLGREFCDKVNDYLKSTGEETQGVGVIQCNPEQSKHLETARMRIFDMWIDFVNLRSEDYAENSRIPTMKFGTAEEDAYRRDLTINSLFYNINTGFVEDFTRRGIADLRSGKIVTPLPPKETFLDDPLRVLRAIRFGARFEFEMDKGLKDAAAECEVKAAIGEKISRERIGHEIDLMMSGNQPVRAMAYISELELFSVVFSFPPKFEPAHSEREDRLCVNYMDAAWRLIQSIGCSTVSDEQKRLSLYAAMFLPFRKTVYRDNKGKKIPVVSYIFLNSLKLKSKDAETVVKLHNTIDKFLSLIPFIISNEDKQLDEIDQERELIDVPAASKLRILAGLLLWEIKDFWRSGLLLSLLLYPSDNLCSTDSVLNAAELERTADLFITVENAITKLGLDKVWEEKPLINGKDIMSILQLKTGGPLIREWQQKLLQWQLAHPSGTAKECIDWMQQTQSKRARIE